MPVKSNKKKTSKKKSINKQAVKIKELEEMDADIREDCKNLLRSLTT